MARKATLIKLTNEEREGLEKRLRKGTEEHRMIVRLKIVLMAADGLETHQIAKRINISKKAVCKWRKRYARYGIEGLLDDERSGRPRKFTSDDRLRVIIEACQPPKINTHWSVRDIEKELKKKHKRKKYMSYVTIHRILKSTDLKPHQYRMWLNSQDPDFEAKKVDVIGLYINPPENAVVLCVDEKTAIQALGRGYPNKPMTPGYCEKIEFQYIRHGTKSLIAAFLVHKGTILGKCYDRHTNEEFVDFLNEIEKKFPSGELHIIVDNLSVHKHHRIKEWLEERDGRIKFHFTPTHASWLNQIELWFSILSRKILKRGIFNSREELVKKIMDFIEGYNKEAKPFRWTYANEPLKI